MRTSFPIRRPGRLAFSLLELMVAVGLLSVVIFALYAMFDQTQKAFRQSLNQAELSEGGRAALDLMVRGVERAATPRVEDALHFVITPSRAVGYEVALPGGEALQDRTQPLRFDDLFYAYQIPGNQWRVAGLFVADPADPAARTNALGIGALYLFDEAYPATNLVSVLEDLDLLGGFVDARDRGAVPPIRFAGPPAIRTNLLTGRVVVPAFPDNQTRRARLDAVRLLDGVIQFRVTSFDGDGRPYDRFHPVIGDLAAPRVGVNTNSPRHIPVPPADWQRTNRVGQAVRPLPVAVVSIDADSSQVNAQFRGTNLPASVELEVTLLDGKQLDQFRSLPDNVSIRNRWLANNAGALQTLRQRVVLRTAPQ